MKTISFTLLLCGILIAVSCGKPSGQHPPSGQQEPSDEHGPTGPPEASLRCFRKITGADTLSVQLRISGDSVSGELDWLPAEKDKMRGTFEGIRADSMLTVIYTYRAEGITAKEEKVFVLREKELGIRYGELVEKDGIWIIGDKSKAVTSEIVPEIPCN